MLIPDHPKPAMSLSGWVRAALVVIVLGMAAVAMQARLPMIGNAPVMAGRTGSSLDDARVCEGTRWSLRHMILTAAGEMARNLFRHTALEGLTGAAPRGLSRRAIDLRRCAVHRIALANHLRIATAAITGEAGGRIGLDAQVADTADEFAPGNVRVTPHARWFFTEIAHEMGLLLVKPVLLIIGHAAGPDSGKIAEAQARDVASVFAQALARRGVKLGNIYYQGAGTAMPLPGKALDQSIEIVSLASKADLQAFLAREAIVPVPPVMHATVMAKRRPMASGFDFGGSPVGFGTPIDLGGGGGPRLGIVGSADAARLAIMPACVDTTAPEASPPPESSKAAAAMPIRNFLPQFYGAPWTGRAGASLIAILDDYAPRDAAQPVPPPQLRIYRGWFAGQRGAAAFAGPAIAMMYHGSAARLYRIYASGPIRCIDIVDDRGSSVASAYLYYQRGNRIYETATMFRVNQ